jgi:S1-C subfamily serine protease
VEVGGLAPGRPATVVVFDSRNDIALLRVPGLGLPPLELARSPRAQTIGAILGYPEDGPFVAEPGRIGHTQAIETNDAYGRGPVVRVLTPLRGLVRPGNSGGPTVDRAGRVLTTVFAATTSPGPAGGYGVANGVIRHELARARGAVSTDGCAA